MTAAFHPMSNASNPELMVVDTAALNLVAKMPDNHAAMSHYEFFAEMYALYYDYDDPKRKAIPATVAKWLDENIGKRDPENPRRTGGEAEAGVKNRKLVLCPRNFHNKNKRKNLPMHPTYRNCTVTATCKNRA